ncbi:1-hydroxy-2-methyl-2-(E)-butenyl 4-diphosphate reductase, 4Fe-4S protein [Georgfuchsia toluolica]|uniref:4-hydroxy-3-methylbut-2-enyl diphosphate reductase n=1 Tax=Georgfuchsia toluolica TaxID=424218 RepID=A0A916J8Y9_9PROT|nr:4-hydroxy-3-methylbut-2-enyl diphosphate reductase [Georgfuchsia toluolica]CAG4885362.1 1-hydroxy-2-methyl-2-(E)-butenyl 4-diphosphate reductase, 4Fe-4S protein [Georgfuchsia toluolica]
MTKTILLANPRGFCAGVDRAIAVVERALEKYGAPVYVRHEVVHNRYVVETLRGKGAVFVEEVDQVPDGAVLVFSAHGVSQAVRRSAGSRELRVLDATCPLVTKVHNQVARLVGDGYEIVMIGHRGHPEVEGTMGQTDGHMYLVENVADVASLRVTNPQKLAYVTQTTLSVDDAASIIKALVARFPAILLPARDDICYATQNRQDAVKSMDCDVLIVVGSHNSSNSNRLREVAEHRGIPGYLVDDAESIDPAWITGKSCIGVTAGASAPELLVQQVVERLREIGGGEVKSLEGIEERVKFQLPKELISF